MERGIIGLELQLGEVFDMKENMNKKSQINIIVVVLLILITIVAIVVLWNIFNPLVKEKSKEINTDALSTNLEIKEAGVFLTGASKVTVTRTSGEEKIDELRFIFYDENGNSHSEGVAENLLSAMESKTYFFSPFSDISKIKKISVFPVFSGKLGIGSSIESGQILQIPSGLVSWWRLNSDFSDYLLKNNGQGIGQLSFAEDEGRKAVSFNSGYVDFSNNPSLDLSKDFAISLWIKSSSKNQEVLRKGSNYKISIDKNGRVDFSYSGSGIIKNKGSNFEISDGKWHHLVITNLMMYVDSNPDKILSIHENLDKNPESLILGKNFKGFADEVMIFNESLSFDQVKGLFNSQE